MRFPRTAALRAAVKDGRCAAVIGLLKSTLRSDLSLSRRLLTIVAALAAGAWICLAEPAKIFRAVSAYNDDEITEPVADGVIAGAALSLFRRKLLLLLFQQVPIKLVIFTHRNQQWAATNNKPQNCIKMGTHRAFRHQLPQILGRTWRSLERRLRSRAGGARPQGRFESLR